MEAGKNISLEAGETKSASFTVIRDVEGTYQVRLDRLLGNFRVIGVAKAPIAWWIWLIIGLVSAAVVGFAVWMVVRRLRY